MTRESNPIELSIYDVDGMEGLYVLASAFREIFQRTRGQMLRVGMKSTMQQNLGCNESSCTMSALQKNVTLKLQAVSKTIKKNKANTIWNFCLFKDANELQKTEKWIQNQKIDKPWISNHKFLSWSFRIRPMPNKMEHCEKSSF